MDEKNGHAGHRARVYDEFLHSQHRYMLPEYKLLELLLFYSIKRSDTKSVAKQLLKSYGSIYGIIEDGADSAEDIAGLGKVSMLLLKYVIELAKRYERSRLIATTTAAGTGARNSIGRSLSECLGKNPSVLGIVYINSLREIVHSETICGQTSLENPESLTKLLMQRMISQNVRCIALGRYECDTSVVRATPSEIVSMHKIFRELESNDFELANFFIILQNGREIAIFR